MLRRFIRYIVRTVSAEQVEPVLSTWAPYRVEWRIWVRHPAAEGLDWPGPDQGTSVGWGKVTMEPILIHATELLGGLIGTDLQAPLVKVISWARYSGERRGVALVKWVEAEGFLPETPAQQQQAALIAAGWERLPDDVPKPAFAFPERGPQY